MIVVDVNGTEVVYSEGVWTSTDTILSYILSTLEGWVKLDDYHPDRDYETVAKVLEKLGQGEITHTHDREPREPGTVY